jgi:hypothetical protein
VEEILRLAVDRLQVYDRVMAEAIRGNTLDKVAGRVLTEVAPRLELMRRVPSAYRLVVENLIPWGIAGFKDYYRKKQKN